jgi:hypothetical protein
MVILCKIVLLHTLLIIPLIFKKKSVRSQIDKSQIVARKVSRLKSLLFLSVGNIESKGYPNNPHTLDELRHICENICRGH